MEMDKLSVIIATKDRPVELRRLLGSIAVQEVKPGQIIVVDGSCESVENEAEGFRGRLNIEYIRKLPASLTAQRNIGMGRLNRGAKFICFFDDDIVLKQGCLKSMVQFWERAAADIGGAGFNVVNEGYKNPTLFERVFLVNGLAPGRILQSGFQSKH